MEVVVDQSTKEQRQTVILTPDEMKAVKLFDLALDCGYSVPEASQLMKQVWYGLDPDFYEMFS